MRRSIDRICTTHVGSLARPPALLDLMRAAAQGREYDPGELAEAEWAGKHNVVASADCGFSSQATYSPEIHPQIVWAKFEALSEGARRATARLW